MPALELGLNERATDFDLALDSVGVSFPFFDDILLSALSGSSLGSELLKRPAPND